MDIGKEFPGFSGMIPIPWQDGIGENGIPEPWEVVSREKPVEDGVNAQEFPGFFPWD